MIPISLENQAGRAPPNFHRIIRPAIPRIDLTHRSEIQSFHRCFNGRNILRMIHERNRLGIIRPEHPNLLDPILIELRIKFFERRQKTFQQFDHCSSKNIHGPLRDNRPRTQCDRRQNGRTIENSYVPPAPKTGSPLPSAS